MNQIERIERVQKAIQDLWNQGQISLPPFNDPVALTDQYIKRESFRSKFTSSWLYYYLPFAATFGSVAPNIIADQRQPKYDAKSQIRIERVGKGKQYEFEARLQQGEEPIPVFEVDSVTLSEIFGEIWYRISSVVGKQNEQYSKISIAQKIHLSRSNQTQTIKLKSDLSFAGFRHQDDREDLISIDILAGWLATSPCVMQTDNLVGCQRLSFTKPKIIGYHPPRDEYEKKKLNWNGVGNLSTNELWSLACFPAFYEDDRCFGTILTTGSETWINGAKTVEHQRTYGIESMSMDVEDALNNGILPFVQSLTKSGTFGYKFKLEVVFGAVSGDTKSGLWASSASFILGMRCFEETALEISKQISAHIGILQNELLDLTARRALRRMFEQNKELENEKARAEDYAKELQRSSKELEHSAQLLNLLQRPFERIATQLNGALKDIQHLQGIYRVPARGVYERAAKTNIMDLFRKDVTVKICNKDVKIEHEPVHYFENELAELVFLAAMAEMTGIPKEEYESYTNIDVFAELLCDRLFDVKAVDKDILTLIRSIVCLDNSEEWLNLVKLKPIVYLEKFKALLHTALKPTNGKDISIEQLQFALPSITILKGQWCEVPGTTSKLFVFGQSNPFPTQAMLIEAITGLIGLNDENVSQGQNIRIKCIESKLIENIDPLKLHSGYCQLIVKRSSESKPFLGLDSMSSPTFNELFSIPSQWREWVNSHIHGASGNFVEPIARAISFAQTSDFHFECRNDNGLYLSWRHDRGAMLTIWIKPMQIEITSSVNI